MDLRRHYGLDIISGTFEANRERLTLFGGAFVTEVEFDALDNAVTNPTIDNALAPAVAGNLLTQQDVENTKAGLSFGGDALYFYYGFDVDYDGWLLTYEYAEYGIHDSGDTFNEVWYVTAGKRFDTFVVSATYGDYQQPIDNGYISTFHPVAQPLARGLIENLATQYYTVSQLSISYNLHPSALLKGDLFSWDPLESGETMTGISVGVDLVF